MIKSDCEGFIDYMISKMYYDHNNVNYVNKDMFLPVGNGNIYAHFGNISAVDIGFYEIGSMKNKNAVINEYDFMKCYISVLHEAAHIYQCQALLNSNVDSAKYVAYSSFANEFSTKYYMDNYRILSHEIAAQYSALKNGYDILRCFVGDEKAESMICNYVNRHIDDEFISSKGLLRKYRNVDDIFDAYNDAFVKSANIHRVLDFEDYRNVFVRLVSNDDFRFDGFYNMILKNDTNVFESLEYLDNGLEQDLCLTKLYLKAHYGDYLRYYDKLSSVHDIELKDDLELIRKESQRISDLDINDVVQDISSMSFLDFDDIRNEWFDGRSNDDIFDV